MFHMNTDKHYYCLSLLRMAFSLVVRRTWWFEAHFDHETSFVVLVVRISTNTLYRSE